jgi:hypothetical protein
MNFLKSAICQMIPTFDPSAAFTHWWASSKKSGSISFIRTGISGPAARQRGNRLDDSAADTALQERVQGQPLLE